MENGERKGNKKQKNSRKRAYEESAAEAEPEVVTESKKEKKRKQKQEEHLNSELFPEFSGNTETCNGSDESSKKKKKKKKDEKVAQKGSLRDGKSGEKKEVLDGTTEKYGESIKIDGGETVETCESLDGVVVSGKDVKNSKYKALKSFADSDLPGEVIECCKNFNKPSPIQSHSWPFLLDGRDFIGIAATGSGKTLAFGIPAIMHVLNKQKTKTSKKVKPLCLVLSPTRELAQQIADVLCDAGKPSGVRTVCLYGGTSKGPQISSLKAGVDIVIGTPGRLRDLIEMGMCQLNEVSFVVLDEADRMLDMGFEQEVRSILSQTCSGAQ